MVPSERRITSALLTLLGERGTATSCPSEVARRLGGDDWRALMPPVRAVAANLQRRGLVDAYQRGRPVKVEEARGAIRLRLREVASIDYRAHPEKYVVGRGETGVLTVEPYKSDLLPLWRFKTPELARRSAAALQRKFREYQREDDFVGMDMARKYLQMGWTRARRYANHKDGRKYEPGTRTVRAPRIDEQKAEAAAIFKEAYDRVRLDPDYARRKREWPRRKDEAPRARRS